MHGICKSGILLTLLWLLSGCSSGTKRQPALGEAYAGPVKLRLRTELGPTSPVAVEVKHGERLEIVGRRRRFVKVRTEKGAEGWTELRQLLSTDQMRALDELAERAGKLPSHGAATVYESLNVHTEPNRLSPSFYQIREGEHVQVVEQKLAPRIPFENPSVLPVKPPEPKAAARKPKREPKYPPPPSPAPPKPPEDWEELSRTAFEAIANRPEPPAPKPVPLDTFALVRMRNGRAGWVLSRMLRMDIPDEVAQYAEGQRITSYFSMGQVDDGGQIKHHWLWTTSAPGEHDYDFDGFRYFVWNLRKHRYETAYIERRLKGFFPVSVSPVEVTMNKKSQTMPGFSLMVEEEDGTRYKKTYAYQIYLVRLIGKEKWEPPPSAGPSTGPGAEPEDDEPEQAKPSLLARLKRLFGK